MRVFIEELRHRNVFRVGVAYVVTGWLIVQVAGRRGRRIHARKRSEVRTCVLEWMSRCVRK